MINITKLNNSIVVTSTNQYAFPFQDGQLTVPLNSITYTIDESDYIAFRSAANNDVIFTATLGDVAIEGMVMDRTNFMDAFNSLAYVAGGSGEGGGGGDITVDGYLSTTSTNPVQNKVITKKINEIVESIEQGGEMYVTNIVEMTQAEYDSIVPEPNTLYIVTDTPPISQMVEEYVASLTWTGTQAEYDALGEYDSNKTYYIIEQ